MSMEIGPNIYAFVDKRFLDGSRFFAAWAIRKSVLFVSHGGPKPKLPKQKRIYPSQCSANVCSLAMFFLEWGNVWKKLFRAHYEQVPKAHYFPAEH